MHPLDALGEDDDKEGSFALPPRDVCEGITSIALTQHFLVSLFTSRKYFMPAEGSPSWGRRFCINYKILGIYGYEIWC